MFDKDKFCGKVREKGLTLEAIADIIGVNPSTLTRKLNGNSDFIRNEIELIRKELDLSDNDVISIFFAPILA